MSKPERGRIRSVRHALIGAVLLSVPLFTLPQYTSVQGVVLSEDDEALPGVTVTITALALEAPRTTTTDEQGRFTFTTLPPGEYTVEARADGFVVSEQTVTAGLNQASALTVILYRRLGSPTERPFTIVRVHYGTNRTRIADRAIGSDYNSTAGPFEFGSVTVSIPRDHRIGDWEQPLTLGTLRQEHHVLLLNVEPQTQAAFITGLRQRVKNSEKQEAFVFVHGYNTTFRDAVTRTAILAYDLKFDGAPITFTWPSRAARLRYAADEEAAQSSIEQLEAFLSLVANESGAARIHLIAHSMGNRVLLEALRALQQRNAAPTNLSQLILTAPDVNVVRFTQLMTHLRTLARRTTLYASKNDKALRASKWFHDYPRAGQAGRSLTVLPGVDTIDVSAVDTSFTGHAYFGDNTSVVSDLFDLIKNDTPPPERFCLSPRPPHTPRWWTFDRCRP